MNIKVAAFTASEKSSNIYPFTQVSRIADKEPVMTTADNKFCDSFANSLDPDQAGHNVGPRIPMGK